MKEWNKLSINQHIKYLEEEFMFGSSGTAKSVFELIRAYKKPNREIEFAKWLQHLDNGTEHYNPFTKEKSPSIGFSPSDCLNDDVYTIEELYIKWKEL